MKSRAATRLALALVVLAGPAARAAGPVPEVKIENVTVGFGDGQSKDGYKLGAWTPVWVDLKGGPSSFSGFLEFTVPDESNTPTTIRRSISVPANEMITVSLLVRPGSRYADVSARVIGSQGGRPKDSWSGGSIEAISPEVSIILSSGQVPGLTEVKDLPKYASNNSTAARLIVAPVRARYGFPGRWYGFDAVDAVVLDTNDPTTLSRLREGGALLEWVRQGGHLIIAVGQNWQAVLDSPFGPALPATPAGQIELNDPGLIDQFAGAVKKPLVAPDAKEKLRVTKFEDWEKRGGTVLKASSVTPLVVRGPYGFGRVTMIGINVDQKPFSTWDDRRLLWDKLLDLRSAAPDTSINSNYFGGNSRNDLSTTLYESLQRFPGVRLVPFGWVAFFVFLYILLIGPGDYLFLRKVIKRMEMTWITFPLIVLTVSGVAYAAAYYFKGTDLRINKVDAIDVDQTTGQMRGWSWLTLFSPQNRDYDVGFAPLSPEAAAPAKPVADWASSRTANVEVLTSWFGTPEANGGGGMGFGGGYDYAPATGEPEEVTGVRVNIWSTKSFSGRWSGSISAPLLESDLTPDGPDRLRGTVTNVTGRPLKNAAVFFGRFVYPLNEIAPGATVTLGEPQVLVGYMDGLTASFPTQNNYYNNQNVAVDEGTAAQSGDRPNLIRALMFHGGLGANAALHPNFAIRSIDLTDQLELRRPMLVADLNGPVAQLRLGGAGRDPKMTQTTVLRVILPLKSEPAAPAAKP